MPLATIHIVVRLLGHLKVVNIADAMHGAEGIKRQAVTFVKFTDFHDILIKRAATHIGVDSPD